MDDLIKKQDAITAYCEHECGIKGMTRENCGATDCGTIFDDIPTADVRENVRGEWKWVCFFKNGGYGSFGCSVCGYRNGTRYNFCPNCGADMRTD